MSELADRLRLFVSHKSLFQQWDESGRENLGSCIIEALETIDRLRHELDVKKQLTRIESWEEPNNQEDLRQLPQSLRDLAAMSKYNDVITCYRRASSNLMRLAAEEIDRLRQDKIAYLRAVIEAYSTIEAARRIGRQPADKALDTVREYWDAQQCAGTKEKA